jgi:hypothetical protein
MGQTEINIILGIITGVLVISYIAYGVIKDNKANTKTIKKHSFKRINRDVTNKKYYGSTHF